jgi:CheY-like chemotaxis protein
MQILINLLTNAIKFTRLETTRRVDVILSASDIEPTSVPGGMQFNEEKLIGDDHHLKDDWKKDNDLIFIRFSVKDTGRGLSEEERGSLFTRFSQASPRTHIHYGGSGLGLFISRRLTELQGGAIGLESEPKKGSTFSFYIKTRRIKPAMVRTGSMLDFLPEDVKHRPQTPLTNASRPPLFSRTSSNRTDNGNGSTSPSPRLRQQPSFHRRSSHPSLDFPMEPSDPSFLHDIQEGVRTKDVPKTMHVLIVEDNLVNQRVLAKQLRNLGCVVNVANHGREAIDFLERTIYWNRDTSQSSPTSQRASFHIPCTEPLPSHSDDTDIPAELSVILMVSIWV